MTPAETNDWLPTRETLLSRLRDFEDDASWREFFETYSKLIYQVTRKAGFTDAAAQDIVQETFVTVARHLPEFRYNPAIGSFKGWLLQITRSRIIDALRRKSTKEKEHFVPRETRFDTSLLESHPADAGVTLETIWEDEWRTHVLETALERVKADTDARQFQMFHLHVIKNMPARDVAQRLAAKLPEVYFAKYKVAARLKREMRRLENNT